MAQLKARLEALGGIEPPGGLRDKLVTAIPGRTASRSRQSAGSSRSGFLRHIAVAAGIVIMASVMVRFLTALPNSPHPVTDINDRGTAAVLTDHNHPEPLDSNCCDSNVVP